MRTEQLLKLLKENRVRFVIIGATAFPVHGYSRATLDIDVFIEPEDDLITMKKAASRTKDIEDLKYLRELKQRARKR